MTYRDLQNAGKQILMLLSHHTGRVPDTENELSPVVYAYLVGRFRKVTRQHPLRIGGHPRPSLIDFRHGTSNPMVIELAVRPRAGGHQLSGISNTRELRKLSMVPHSKAKRRALLLLDLSSQHLEKHLLRNQ